MHRVGKGHTSMHICFNCLASETIEFSELFNEFLSEGPETASIQVVLVTYG